MHEVWSHRTAIATDRARSWARSGRTVVVETRSPGSYDETVTSLVALDVTSGAPRWQRTCPPVGPVQSIAADSDLVAVLHVGDRPLLRGYDAATGTELWSHSLTGDPRGVALVGDEVVVVAGSTVRRVDRDGRLVAKASLRGTQLSTIAVTPEGDLVTTSGRGTANILRLHGESLELDWAAKVPGEGWTYRVPPLVTADTVYFHAASLWAMALDAVTGEVRWRKKKAVGRTGAVFAGPDGSWFRGTDTLARVRPSDGKPAWETPRVLAAAPAGAGPDHVVVARREDAPYTFDPDEPVGVDLVLLDARTGEETASTALTGIRKHWVSGDMSERLFTVVDGILLSGLKDGRVRAFDLA